jgi:hypothetical protein
MNQRAVFALVIASMSVLPACSSLAGITAPTPTTPPVVTRVPVSDDTISRIVGNFARGAGNATNNVRYGAVQPPSATGLISKMVSVLVNQPFSSRTSCETGGYHEISGRISGTVSDTGISRLQMNATQSINNYACMGGGWIINGDPYISNTGEVRITGNQASVDFGQALGWKAINSATGQSFSCTHNIRITWDTLNDGRVSGRVTCSPPSTTVSINMTF